METKTATSPEYDKFNSLANRVLSMPKAEAQRIVEESKRETKRVPKVKDGKRAVCLRRGMGCMERPHDRRLAPELQHHHHRP
jgi:hypothetical protein